MNTNYTAPDLDLDLEDDDEDDDYLDSMWDSSRFGATGDASKDLMIAHGMVQSFVNAFARDGHYVVGFDNVDTAGTDMNTKRVIITTGPIADPTISSDEAGRILTGLAVHEISHPRYGRRTWQAVQAVFPGNAIAQRLSNLLDDVRIERRFVADYPGYANVFTPTLDYVGRSSTKNGLHVQRVDRQVNLAIAAIRYPAFSEWNLTTTVEAAWWTDWAERGAEADAPKDHVTFIREALAHIVAVKAGLKPQPQAITEPGPRGEADPNAPKGQSDPESTETSAGESNDANDAGEESGDDKTSEPASNEEIAGGAGEPNVPSADPMTDEELNDSTRNDTDEARGEGDPMHSVENASVENGADRREIRELTDEAETIIEASRNLEDNGHGEMVDVAKTLRHLTSGGAKLGPSSMASRYIRNAILRSRTGTTETTQHQKRGRLDGHGLARVGYGDTRIFESRKAPSPGRYNILVMVDASGSMSGWGTGYGGPLAEAAQVAHAMATATQGTPSVRLSVYAWSSPFRSSYADAGVAKVWESGQDADQIFRMTGLQTGGTPDSASMSWAAKHARRSSRQGETPVVIFISDGCGDRDLNERIAEARRAGIVVVGVSFGYDFKAADLLARYGKDNYVPFEGTITKTAKPLADLFARVTSGKSQVGR